MTAESPSDASGVRLSLPRLVGFSLPGITIGALAVTISVYLPHFYAAHFGLGLFWVGVAFTLTRLMDVFFDPFIGSVMDRTRNRFGRYRAWLLMGVPVLVIGAYMLFLPPGGVNVATLIFWLLVYYVGWSIITLSHASWASVIAAKYHERSRVFGAIQVVSVIGATLVLIIPSAMGKAASASGADMRAMGWFICIAAILGVALAAWLTPEKQNLEGAHHSVTFKDYWEMISRPDMRRIVIADFCLALGPGWMSALYLFYFRESRGFEGPSASLLLLIYIGAGVFGAGIMSRVAMSFGKHKTLMAASTGYSLGLLSLVLMPKGNFALTSIPMFILGFLAASFPLLDRAMVADVADAVRLESGKHRVGVLFAMITSSQKVAAALSIGLSFPVLAWVGFNPKAGAVNTPGAILGLDLVYLITPVVFVMIGGACYIGYKLDHHRHAEIRKALDERDAETAPAAAASAIEPDAPPALAAS